MSARLISFPPKDLVIYVNHMFDVDRHLDAIKEIANDVRVSTYPETPRVIFMKHFEKLRFWTYEYFREMDKLIINVVDLSTERLLITFFKDRLFIYQPSDIFMTIVGRIFLSELRSLRGYVDLLPADDAPAIAIKYDKHRSYSTPCVFYNLSMRPAEYNYMARTINTNIAVDMICNWQDTGLILCTYEQLDDARFCSAFGENLNMGSNHIIFAYLTNTSDTQLEFTIHHVKSPEGSSTSMYDSAAKILVEQPEYGSSFIKFTDDSGELLGCQRQTPIYMLYDDRLTAYELIEKYKANLIFRVSNAFCRLWWLDMDIYQANLAINGALSKEDTKYQINLDEDSAVKKAMDAIKNDYPDISDPKVCADTLKTCIRGAYLSLSKEAIAEIDAYIDDHADLTSTQLSHEVFNKLSLALAKKFDHLPDES